MQLQAIIGDILYDLDIGGARASVDGDPVDVRVHRLSDDVIHLLVDGKSYVMTVVRVDERTVHVTHAGRTRVIGLKTPRDLLLDRLGMGVEPDLALQELRAPMPGLVLQVLVEPGSEVAPGDGLIVLEAMKMENELRADLPGKVKAVHVEAGSAVSKGELLLSFE
jgi:biotin carboxyl carrier protein